MEINPLRIQRTAGGTVGRLVVWQGKVVPKKKKKKNLFMSYITESWDSCDFNYVNHFKIL